MNLLKYISVITMISVIVPTYKAPEALDICLKSATENQAGQNEIIVVVDGFYELNKPVLDKYEGKICILDLETNQGLCKATNMGVYNATSDKILIVNDDNVFPRNWDTKLLKTYQKNWVIAPNQIEPKPSIYGEFIIKPFGQPNEFDYTGFLDFADSMSQPEVIGKKGSTLPIFMSKEDYLAIGGWDESYPGAWVVDLEFFYKCKLAGFELARNYECLFYHFVSVGTEVTPKEKATKAYLERECWDYFKYKWGFYPERNREDYTICSTS